MKKICTEIIIYVLFVDKTFLSFMLDCFFLSLKKDRVSIVG